MQIGPYTAREHQIRMFHESRQAIREMIQSGVKPYLCVVAPTGSGKTIYSSLIMDAMKAGKRVAFIVSGRQLVIQKSRTLSRCEIPHSVMMADIQGEIDDRGDRFARVFSEFNQESFFEKVVISKDTLESRKFSMKKLGIDLVIVDECHQSLSDKWIEILEEAECPVIGVTATPIDGRGYGLRFYNKTIVGATYSELIQKNLLVPCRVFIPFIVELRRRNGEQVKVGSDGEYVRKHVDEVFNEEKLLGDIVKSWKELADNRPTLVYASSVAHAIALKDEFVKHGITAEHVNADTSHKDRSAIYSRFENGETKVLTNYSVLKIGVDFPCAEVIQVAVSMNSLSQFLQTVGRGLRTYTNEETGYVKRFCCVIDHGGNVIGHDGNPKHGWPTDDRQWPTDVKDVVKRIDPKTGNPTDKQPKMSICPKCKIEKGGVKKCPNCGHEHQKTGVMLRTVNAEFKEITPKDVKQKKETSDEQKMWNTCLGITASKNGPVAMAMSIFRSKMGKPVPNWVSPQPEPHQLRMKVRAVWPGYYRRKANA